MDIWNRKIEKILQRAKQKYLDSERNYKYLKGLLEEYRDEKSQDVPENHIIEVQIRMNHEFDKMQDLTYIFGGKI